MTFDPGSYKIQVNSNSQLSHLNSHKFTSLISNHKTIEKKIIQKFSGEQQNGVAIKENEKKCDITVDNVST